MANYISPLAAGLSSVSSLARGWATMKFQLDKEEQADNRWQMQYAMQQEQFDLTKAQFEFDKTIQTNAEGRWQKDWDMRKLKMDQDLSLANRQYDFETAKLEAGKGLRDAQLTLTQQQTKVANYKFNQSKKIQSDTEQANVTMFSSVPDLLEMDLGDMSKTMAQNIMDVKRKFPNADMTNFINLFKMISNSKIASLGGSELSGSPQTIVGPDGKEYLQYMLKNNTKGMRIAKNTWSEGVQVITEHHRGKIAELKKRKLEAFALGQKAKFAGEITVAISDMNQLEMTFKDAASYANRLSIWIENDADLLKLRSEYDRELSSVIKDPKQREILVDGMYGPSNVRPTEEMHAAAINYYTNEITDAVRLIIEKNEGNNKPEILAGIYGAVLNTEQGVTRYQYEQAIKHIVARDLSPQEIKEYEYFANQHAYEWSQGQGQRDFDETEQDQQDYYLGEEFVGDWHTQPALPAKRELINQPEPPPIPEMWNEGAMF